MKKPKGKYAWTVTVGEKGQIVIPKQAREIFDISPGDTLILLHNLPLRFLIQKRIVKKVNRKIFA